MPQYAAYGDGISGFAPKQHITHGSKCSRLLVSNLVEQCRRQKHGRHALLPQVSDEVGQRQQQFLRNAYQLPAMQQRAPNLKRSRVKRGIGNVRQAIVGTKLNIVGMENQPVNGLLRDDDTLGLPGRAGGVHHVSDIGGGGLVVRILVVGGGNSDGGGIQIDRACLRRQMVTDLRHQDVVREYDGCADVGEHKSQSLGGIGGIQRDVDPTRLDDG